MAGRNRTYLGIYLEDAPTEADFLMVGGGLDGNYVCSYYTNEVEYCIINKIKTQPGTVIAVPIGQMNAKKKMYCNDLLQCTRYVKRRLNRKML
jgi:hypothetical protein